MTVFVRGVLVGNNTVLEFISTAASTHVHKILLLYEFERNEYTHMKQSGNNTPGIPAHTK